MHKDCDKLDKILEQLHSDGSFDEEFPGRGADTRIEQAKSAILNLLLTEEEIKKVIYGYDCEWELQQDTCAKAIISSQKSKMSGK